MNFMAKKLKEYQMRKSRYTFKLDTSNAQIGAMMPSTVGDDGYECLITNITLLCKNEIIATGLSGTLAISNIDITDSAFVDELYEKMYKEQIDDYEDAWEREHEDDPDYGTNYEILSEELKRRNVELDSMFETVRYELVSIKKLPSMSFKGSYDEYDGAELDDDYIDELKANIGCRIILGEQTYDYDVKTDYTSFIPSDEMEGEMIAFMESESTED